MTEDTENVATKADYPIVELGPLDQSLHDDFWNQMTKVREECPVGWTNSYWSTENPPGQWMINDYPNVMAAATNWRTFSSAGGVASIQFPLDLIRLIPVEVDPPLHRDVRSILHPFFTPAALAENDDNIQQIAADLIAECLTKEGPVDIVSDFNAKLPPIIFLGSSFLDSTPDQASVLLDLISTLLTKPEATLEAAPKLLEWCAGLLEARRRSKRTDDLVGVIAHMGLEEDSDLQIEERQRIETLNLVVMAGMETTMGGLGAITWQLATRPDLRAELRSADERTLDRAVDEFIRFASPVPTSGRTITTDTVVAECPMKSGDRVLINWAAANLDPEHFPEPTSIDFNRHNIASHVAFGAGIHRCLGSHLAKREIKAAIREICDLSRFELVEGHDVRWRAGFARGPVAVPVHMAR